MWSSAMRVAITGASGFVGRYVLQELQSRNLDIVVASRSSSSLVFKHARTKVVTVDIAEKPADPFEKLGSPDVLIHLAWDGLPNYQSAGHVEKELPAQQRFLKACLTAGLKRLIVTGTCFEYGQVSGQVSENMPASPCTQYGIAKNALNEYLKGLKSEYPFQLAWMRLFYLYGHRQSKNSLYSLLIDAIKTGKTALDMSGGEQVRDFLPIEEAARLLTDVALLASDVGVVNLCSGVPIKVRELVETWISGMNSPIAMNLGRIPYVETEPMSFWGDRTKLNTLLGKS
jgi:nucleoside-diphosphate-sugar epimerase